jgi:monoamine oxidase
MSDSKYCPRQAQRTRRSIVKMGAIAAPVVLANLGGTRHAAAYDAESGSEQRYDVIVIGAGVSGLAAAKALHAAGYLTLTLEARDRIGGRIFTDRNSGATLDMGASWIHGPRGNPITRLLQDAGASLYKTNFDSLTLYSGGRKVADSRGTTDFYRYIERRKDDMKTDESLATAFESYIREREISGDREAIVRHIVYTDIETEFGTNMYNLSLKCFNEDKEYKGGDVFVASGYDALVNELSRNLDIRLHSPVDTIRDTRTGVIVSVGGNDYRARYVVVTIPLGVLQKSAISFSPPLSEMKTRALEGLGMGNLHKTYLEFAHDFWDGSQTIDIVRGDTKWREFINLTVETGKPILLALHAGEAASNMRQMSNDQIANEAFSVLRTAYSDAMKPLRATTTAWEDDPYAYGSYSFVKVGGSLEMYDDLSSPQGRVYFAGEHTNSNYPATVHGAYLSGVRAARMLQGEAQ